MLGSTSPAGLFEYNLGLSINGNVGIGIASPDGTLHLGETDSTLYFGDSSTARSELIFYGTTTDSGSYVNRYKIDSVAGTGSNAHIWYDDQGDEVMSLNNRGDISLTGTVIPDNDCGIPGTAFTAEENGVLENYAYEFGFGNGGAGANMRSVQICSGVITGMSWRCDTAGTNTEVSIAISDGGNSGCSCLSSGNQCTNTCNIPFNSGNGLNGYTVAAGGAGDCVLTWWVKYD
jgi:hypothetical protein